MQTARHDGVSLLNGYVWAELNILEVAQWADDIGVSVHILFSLLLFLLSFFSSNTQGGSCMPGRLAGIIETSERGPWICFDMVGLICCIGLKSTDTITKTWSKAYHKV